jgi:UDPglucose--hexose-1-phosphate uridylyltransferase
MASPAPNLPQNAELRKHYFLDTYVLIAPSRSARPDSFGQSNQPHIVPSDHCPFDKYPKPGVWQHPRGNNWQIKVFRNDFPALTPENPKAFGYQEVIIDTPRHDIEFSDLSLVEIELVFQAYRHRLTELSRLDGIRYVLIFKNDGPAAGASVAHPHCQVYALPLVPRKIQLEADALNHYRDDHGTCAYCDIILWERQQKVRIVADDKHFIAIAPYASSYAMEVWLIPHRHVNHFAELNASELHSLAVILKKIAARLDASSISFNYFLQESLAGQDHHFVLKVEPRTTLFGGAELALGIEIVPVPPEASARWYSSRPRS